MKSPHQIFKNTSTVDGKAIGARLPAQLQVSRAAEVLQVKRSVYEHGKHWKHNKGKEEDTPK